MLCFKLANEHMYESLHIFPKNFLIIDQMIDKFEYNFIDSTKNIDFL
jgi:hypothetical protein